MNRWYFGRDPGSPPDGESVRLCECGAVLEDDDDYCAGCAGDDEPDYDDSIEPASFWE